MTTVLVDSSVILAAFDNDDNEYRASKALLENSSITIATLDLARYEVVNVAIRAWKSPSEVAPLLAAIEQIAQDGGVVRSGSGLLASAASFASNNNITVYDATYVVAARDAGHKLLSCDI